ncbi:hypothetical protein PUMCH_003758 [Australozyma saopauloensis]|uniref:Protein YIP n=1 Tax=Australozyma saopauloensis TaxID=291208 RepID=A0AAX4HCZ6_9ASCO|nr:hypothetical protein PUMCH_003758 [[Candida] saopauloensis]
MSKNRPELDQFIIADEEDTYKTTSTSQQPQQAPNPQSSANSSTPFSWAPKVDLSSAFLPFAAAPDAAPKVEERQFQGGDTLDEPVWHTLRRDLVQIGQRLAMVVWPAQLQKMARAQQGRLVDFAARNGVRLSDSVSQSLGGGTDTTENTESLELGTTGDKLSLDWDLWGPLMFSLGYAVTMGLTAPSLQKNVVFSNSFSFIWFFYLVVGINIQLLGGLILFLSAISATGYLMFPIVLGAVLSTVLFSRGLIRLIIMSITTLWSVYAVLMSLKCSGVLPGRVLLTIYPIALLYMVLAWIAVIT